MSRLLYNLGVSLKERYERFGELSDISDAVSVLQKAVDLLPLDDPSLPSRLTSLGLSLMGRFVWTDELSDIVEAIPILQRAVDLTPETHPAMPGRLTSLGSSFRGRFKRTDQLSDITEAVSAHRKAVELTPNGHGNIPLLLNNLAVSLITRFGHMEELPDISESISLLQRALALTLPGHPAIHSILVNLGGAFTSRFNRTDSLSDITEAISALQQAVQLAPQGHSDIRVQLSSLGISSTRRFERTGDLSDIDTAILAQRKAVELTPEGHADLPGQLSSLGLSYTCRFQRTGVLSDIAEAVAIQRRAMELIPHGHVSIPSTLTNLGMSLSIRFERSGELSDVTEAISILQRAIELTPHGDSRTLASRLTNLGLGLRDRFEWTGELSDITEAVSAQRRALDLTPEDYSLLTNFAISLSRRFKLTGELSDIDEAISAQQKAVELIPEDHTDMPGQLNSLAVISNMRPRQTGRLTSIAEALLLQRKVVELTPRGHASLPPRLGNLADLLTRRFEETGELSDISEVIALHQRAIEYTPQGDINISGQHTKLGNAFNHRFLLGGNSGDLDDSIAHFKSEMAYDIGWPQDRLEAALACARSLNRHRPYSNDILPAFAIAINMIALIAGLERTVQGRYTKLQTTSGLALEAAAAACRLGRADKALEWLEQGRCHVWSQLNNLRTQLSDLRDHNKSLANRLEDISKRLELAGSSRGLPHTSMSMSEKISLEDEARAHLELAREWDEALQAARGTPGFEAFLMPPVCSTLLQHLPDSGPIVVINVDERRCDALALLAGMDTPLHIPLPNFSVEKGRAYRTDLEDQLYAHSLREPLKPKPERTCDEDERVLRVLRGLWEDVAKPILDGLGISKATETSTDLLPRIWWCPTGLLSFLPLHAAGIYRGADSESVLDYVVSSYTPNVAAITDRVKSQGPIAMKSGLFLTSQPDAPGTSPIPGTTKEVQSIFRKAEETGLRALKLEGDELGPGECLERMLEFSSIHLACHASQDSAEPLESRFLFHQGSLDLGTILKANLKHADLAFLSACQTSTGDEKISDEAVHLAAGMLAAGYRRVVATMWSIGDQPAQEVATNFYEYLFAHQDGAGGSGFDGAMSAYALHHAIQQLRRSQDDSERSLLTWIPFVHFGY
ncbi:CHAT domain-containing protein [Ephemerocybe angulata]|uniref:CHAT domain-containing protein n=1 Tax=Ephemerocybe angulata TaxID=980116 RepID=A0A8H6IFH2_9AGAR|nr:CHAT domain-containing protein [Tulosesus angulatus]